MLTKARKKRKIRVRSKILQGPVVPRLSVYRSNKYIYGQIVDDTKGVTLVAYNDVKMKGNKTERAGLVGEKMAQLAVKNKIERVVFDRSGYAYHGRVKALADGARRGGLKI